MEVDHVDLLTYRFQNVNQSVHTLDEDTSNISPGSYFNNLGLKYFASEPLRMVSRMVSRHKRLTESCLENNNPEALKHLRHSAHGIYNKGTYLCVYYCCATEN
ncbi:hypothetical protein YC2023_011180 [Brassica napus]